MKNFVKTNKGITLIALVITIVVLLILAGVSVNALFGNNGIIKRAKDAQNKMDQAAQNDVDRLNDISDQIGYLTGEKVNWSKVIGDANQLIEEGKIDNIKPTDQVVSTLIGIGTDGKPVNMDLWNPVLIEGGWRLSATTGSGGSTGIGYVGNIENGKIIGEVPQYIYNNESKTFLPVISMNGCFRCVSDLEVAPKIPETVIDMAYCFWYCFDLKKAPLIPESVKGLMCCFYDCRNLTTAPTIPSSVTSMFNTFGGCTSLTTAPTIPSSVTDMSSTFEGCTSLTTAPTIPSSVTDIGYTFSGCSKLQGTIEINANPTSYSYCFSGAATKGSGLVVTGTSTILDEIIATKGTDNTKITKGN